MSTISRFIKYIPVLNLFYDIFFNGTPSIEAIKDSLNVQALLSALLIAIVISYPGAFEYDELKEATLRVGRCYYAFDPDPFMAANYLREEVFYSTLFLSNNVLMVVLVYLSLAGLKLNDELGEERFENWYYYVRFLLVFMTLFMVAGGASGSRTIRPRFAPESSCFIGSNSFVTTSKALVTTSDALVPNSFIVSNSFLLLLVRYLLLLAMHLFLIALLFLIAFCYY